MQILSTMSQKIMPDKPKNTCDMGVNNNVTANTGLERQL